MMKQLFEVGLLYLLAFLLLIFGTLILVVPVRSDAPFHDAIHASSLSKATVPARGAPAAR